VSDNTRHAYVTVDGKSAVVIGGTSGIGRAIALGFATEGADVIATSRNESSAEAVSDELEEIGATTAVVTCDVQDQQSLSNLSEVAQETLGHVDVLVNSAGVIARDHLADLSQDKWARDIDVLLTGVYRATRLFAKQMTSGSIINISSMSADQARENRTPYCAAKAGVNGFTRAAAADLAPEIRVNAIAPGFVRTPITQGAYEPGRPKFDIIQQRSLLPRVASPDEIVGTAIYLASDAASFTTGEVITVDGGFSAASI
jgi:NAD(P)-dependent dehydrogenase (short-subunit alcohol dehydrogenase family)